MMDTVIAEEFEKPCPIERQDLTEEDSCKVHHPDRDLFCTREINHEGLHHAHGPEEQCYAQWI